MEREREEKTTWHFVMNIKKRNNMIKTTGITTCSHECTLQPKGFGLLMTYMFACSKHDIFEMWRINTQKNETNYSKKNTQRIMRTYLSKRLTSPMCTRLVTLQKQWTIIKPYIIRPSCTLYSVHFNVHPGLRLCLEVCTHANSPHKHTYTLIALHLTYAYSFCFG